MANSSQMYCYFYPYFWNGKNRFVSFHAYINNGDTQSVQGYPNRIRFDSNCACFVGNLWRSLNIIWVRGQRPLNGICQNFLGKKPKQVQKWKEFDDLDFLPFLDWMPQAWLWQCNLNDMNLQTQKGWSTNHVSSRLCCQSFSRRLHNLAPNTLTFDLQYIHIQCILCIGR